MNHYMGIPLVYNKTTMPIVLKAQIYDIALAGGLPERPLTDYEFKLVCWEALKYGYHDTNILDELVSLVSYYRGNDMYFQGYDGEAIGPFEAEDIHAALLLYSCGL